MITQYYLNNGNTAQVCDIPDENPKYLQKKNYLSEFKTEDDKEQARDNLGITDIISQIQQSIENIDVIGGIRLEGDNLIIFSSDNEPIGNPVDLSKYTKDGMLNTVIADQENKQLTFIWNEDANYKQINIPFAQLFDSTNYYNKDEIDTKITNLFELDTVNEIVKFPDDGHIWYAPIYELVAPAAPTLNNNTANIITGNFTTGISCSTPGATIQYSLDGGQTWTTGNSVTIVTGYQNNIYNEPIEQIVYLKSIKNGLTSAINSDTVTINPKLAVGNITISRSEGDYSSNATITFIPTDMIDAVSLYTTDGLSQNPIWEVFDSVTTIVLKTSDKTTIPSGKYKVKTEDVVGYVNSDIVSSNTFMLNKEKVYYGYGGSSLDNMISNIKALKNDEGLPNSINKDTLKGEYTIEISSYGNNSYIWFCGPDEFDNTKDIYSGGYYVPTEGGITITSGNGATYHCYRVSGAVISGTHKFKIV